MEPALKSTSLPALARRFLLFPNRLSLVSFQDLLLSRSFQRRGLIPVSVDLPPSAAGAAATIHIWIPAEPRHSLPPLVLIHGFGANAKWQWDRQIGPLSRFFNLYVPDLIHFGGSRSDGKDFSVGFQSRCLAAAMKQLGVSKYSVVGISYGGYVAYRLATDAGPAVVDRVVIMTAGIGATAEETKALAEKEKRDVSEILLPRKPEDLMALMRRSVHRPPRWMPTFLLRDFIEVMYTEHRKERVELLKELLTKGVGIDPLPVLDQETLIIWGDQDNVFPLHLAHRLQRHLGEKSTLEIIPDAGHALQLDKSNCVTDLIENFMLDKLDDS
ncbi:Triacylglycerol lipase protein [Dioscorea alata]|uniref:Triacylglycerol lipase protein n=1 Tax=Dioscorea alata TaxID=55571 RepID=A0ACB7U880_DIOAL|nr:Triacylglycerol lipase protein [Dioscorea alata]